MSSIVSADVFRIAIGSNFTIKPIHNVISYWCNQLQLTHEVIFAPYQQILQHLIDPQGIFSSNAHGANMLFLRLEDCLSGIGITKESTQSLKAFLVDLERALEFFHRGHAVPLIFVECPSSSYSKEDGISRSLLQHYRHRLLHVINKFSSVFYIQESDIFDLYPMEIYEDHFAYREGKIPYTRECFSAIGTAASRKMAAIIRKPYKVIVLDCDNTLWKGVCAEDGPENLVLDDNYRMLQARMVEMHRQGFLLCLCSKNIEEDVWATFKYYELDMPLHEKHIIASRINWAPKSENIKSLSEELNLGLDSFIFLDDNAVEVAEVSSAHPQVACMQIPSESTQIPAFLKHLWLLDQVNVNETDVQRTLFYQQDKNRKQAEKRAFSFDEFINQLELNLNFSELSEGQLDRVAQMTSRTNQFNFTGERFSASTLGQIYMASNHNCLVIDAKDKYGDYGIIGCVFYSVKESTMTINNFLISCRALGKKIEYRIWAYLSELAIRKGIIAIDVIFMKNERNEAAAIFLSQLGMPEVDVGKEVIYTHLLNK